MNAEMLIVEIGKLSGSEFSKVADFVRSHSANARPLVSQESGAPFRSGPKFMGLAKAKAISEGVFDRNDTLFRKLAQ